MGSVEAIGVGRLTKGRLVIWYVRITEDGLDMSSSLIFEETSAEWLIDKMDRAADDVLPRTQADLPPDSFTVYASAGDRGRPHFVNVHNRRPGTGPLGNVCVLTIETPALAKEAASKLRALIGSTS